MERDDSSREVEGPRRQVRDSSLVGTARVQTCNAHNLGNAVGLCAFILYLKDP
jgi:hypothetical protein